MQRLLIYQIFLKNNSASSKSNAEKLDIDKLVKVSSSLKSKLANLDINKLKNVPIDLKKISGVDDKDVLSKSKYNSDKQGLDKI